MYGLTNGKAEIIRLSRLVCEVLGNGKNGTAHLLLIETCGAETNFGTFEDKTINAGMGLTQIDKLPFYDIKDRTKKHNKEKLKRAFGINIDLVEWEHLRYNPLLSLIFTRLKYKLIPDEIPENLEGRAKYWKVFYNTILGKGTEEHYLDVNKV